MADDIGLFEAIHTQRALRYIKPDPVPDALVRKVVEAGTRAPNGGNQQRWRFVVIKDAETKRWIRSAIARPTAPPTPHRATRGRRGPQPGTTPQRSTSPSVSMRCRC
jgi:nitroreductase